SYARAVLAGAPAAPVAPGGTHSPPAHAYLLAASTLAASLALAALSLFPPRRMTAWARLGTPWAARLRPGADLRPSGSARPGPPSPETGAPPLPLRTWGVSARSRAAVARSWPTWPLRREARPNAIANAIASAIAAAMIGAQALSASAKTIASAATAPATMSSQDPYMPWPYPGTGA